MPPEELLNHVVECRTTSHDHSESFVATSRAQLSSAIAASAILKSLISAVCYCLCDTHGEKERDTRECPRCHSDPADSHTSRLLFRTANSPSAPELELLAPIFGFLLSMFLTIRESLLNTSTLGLMSASGLIRRALRSHWTLRRTQCFTGILTVYFIRVQCLYVIKVNVGIYALGAKHWAAVKMQCYN